MDDAKKRPAKSGGDARAEEFEDQIFKAMRLLGGAIPETDTEVRQALDELESDPVILPPELHDPAVTWNRVELSGDFRTSNTFAEDGEVAANLARAARDGGELTPEIAERMQKDKAVTVAQEKRNGRKS